MVIGPPFVSIEQVERGALTRVELRIDLESPAAEQIHPMLLEILVERAVATVRIAPQLSGSGASIEGGCGTTRCTIAVEGLRGIGNAATEALLYVFADSTVRFGLFERMRLQRAWEDRVASDDAVLKGAMVRAFSTPNSVELRRLDAAAVRPVFGRIAVDTASKRLSCDFTAPIGGSASEESASYTSRCGPTPVALPYRATDHREITRVLTVGDPSARVWVAVGWASTGKGVDLLRDALLVGDFESLAVQGLREGTTPVTYDVEAASGTGWSAAVFQTSAADAERAAAYVSGLVTTVDEVPTDVARGAYLRLMARHAGTRDSLAGQLADLPEMPAPPGGPIPDGAVLGTVLFGGESTTSNTHWTRCQALNGTFCR